MDVEFVLVYEQLVKADMPQNYEENLVKYWLLRVPIHMLIKSRR